MILVALAAAAAAAALTSAPDPTAVLRAKDQALLDSIAGGGRRLWDVTLAPGAIYVDENGRILDRATLLKEMEPLGPGASGTIAITDYQASFVGDLPLVVHTDEEHEAYHGQDLLAHYRMTETWRQDGADWRLLMVHAYAMLRPPLAVTLPAAVLDSYVGRYRAGADLIYVIARDGDHLVGGREGKPGQPLIAEIADVLFDPGRLRDRKLFQRDAQGRIAGFVDRREGGDLTWRRLGDGG